MNKFVAVCITKNNWWVVVSIPCSKEEAEKLDGCEMEGETFRVVTLEEANSHDKVLGREYLTN